MRSTVPEYLALQVVAVDVLVIRVAWDTMIFAGPFSQIDELAAF